MNNTHYITTKNISQAIKLLIDTPRIHSYFGLDTETTGLRVHVAKIRLLQIAIHHKEDEYISFVFDLFTLNSKDKSNLATFLKSNKFYIHNAMFDLPMLQQEFDIPFIRTKDTMCMYSTALRSKYSDTKSPIKYPKSLFACMKSLFDIEINKEEQGSNWSLDTLSEEQIQYAGLDPIYTLMVGEKLCNAKVLNTDSFKITCGVLNALARMKLIGIYLDTEALDILIKEWNNKSEESYKDCISTFKDINLNSSKQLGEWLTSNVDKSIMASWERTNKGAISTDANTIKKHLHEVPSLTPLVNYKKYTKYISTYGESLKSFINPITKRIHPEYKIAYTDTGRLSSMQPNIQNFPREEWYRKLFVPQNKGCIMVCADYSQVEVRVAAILSNEKRMIDAYKQGKDLYKHTASLLLHKEEADITKQERQQAKAVVLGLQFGMGAKTLCEYALNYGVNLSLEESQIMITEYKKAYPNLYYWQQETTSEARNTLYTKTVCGMIRALSEENYYTCSLNTPVQGSAAESILYAIMKLDYEIIKRSLPARLIATVHDEILVECNEYCVETIKDLMNDAMISGFKYVFDRIGIKGADTNIVEAHEGYSWYDAK